MLHLALASLLVPHAVPYGASGSPCSSVRTVEPISFVGSPMCELEVQRECLVWKALHRPTAEFIPASVRCAPVVIESLPTGPGPIRKQSAAALMGLVPGAQAFSLNLQVFIPAEAPKQSVPSPVR
jgi:hypothetical protein